MIHIVDYGLGNVQAFMNVYYRLGIDACLASTAEQLENAERIILPGVGAFDRAMRLLDDSGMRPVMERLALNENVPVLGICVGMQMLGDGSDEGNLPGLGWIPGQVKSFASQPESAGMPLPHMGWNDVYAKQPSPILANLEANPRFYFLHSFYFECDNSDHIAAASRYGHEFSCIVAANNIYGAQFHPEKSHHWGTQLLKNFAELENVAS